MDYTRPGLYRRKIAIRQRDFYDDLVYYTPWIRHDNDPERKLDKMDHELVRFGFKYANATLAAISDEFKEYLDSTNGGK